MKTGNRFPALRLVRAGNCVVAGATSLAGSWASTATLARDKPWLLAIAAMLIAAFGNAYNDICDLPADRVNRPDRVLVRGDLDMTLAMRLAGWCLALGLMLAAYAFVNALILAVTVATVLFLYDRNLKFQPLVGNAAIATICGATVAFGAMAGAQWNRQVVILIVCAFSLTLVRELSKDIQDVEGDRAMGAKTFPILFGERRSAQLALSHWLHDLFRALPDLQFDAGLDRCLRGGHRPDQRPGLDGRAESLDHRPDPVGKPVPRGQGLDHAGRGLGPPWRISL